jgi:hypothetical protein
MLDLKQSRRVELLKCQPQSLGSCAVWNSVWDQVGSEAALLEHCQFFCTAGAAAYHTSVCIMVSGQECGCFHCAAGTAVDTLSCFAILYVDKTHCNPLFLQHGGRKGHVKLLGQMESLLL